MRSFQPAYCDVFRSLLTLDTIPSGSLMTEAEGYLMRDLSSQTYCRNKFD